MKMHPKPMKRHTRPAMSCVAVVESQSRHPLPVHIVLTIDGKTQRICMTVIEAELLARRLLEAAGSAA